MYIQRPLNMVRRMKATITHIENVVTPSGNSGHVVVPKAWIGKEAVVTLKEERAKVKEKRDNFFSFVSNVQGIVPLSKIGVWEYLIPLTLDVPVP
jgi:putative transposon-encoded protein